MEQILNFITKNGFTVAAAVGVIGMVLNIILKKFVTNKMLENLRSKISVFFKGLGIAVTLGLSKVKYVKSVWNSVIEPYVIILLRTIVISALDGFIMGLETDNPSTKDD